MIAFLDKIIESEQTLLWLFVSTIIGVALDCISTGLALYLLPDIAREAMALTACMIEKNGLVCGLAIMTGIRVIIAMLLYYSTFPVKTRNLCMLALASTSIFAAVWNFVGLGINL